MLSSFFLSPPVSDLNESEKDNSLALFCTFQKHFIASRDCEAVLSREGAEELRGTRVGWGNGLRAGNV